MLSGVDSAAHALLVIAVCLVVLCMACCYTLRVLPLASGSLLCVAFVQPGVWAKEDVLMGLLHSTCCIAPAQICFITLKSNAIGGGTAKEIMTII